MNKGRLFVVNQDTLAETRETNTVSIKTPDLTGAQWLKTVSDIMADMLQIEIGDYIFLWETSAQGQKSRIHGVYRAISAPYYKMNSRNDEYPFKLRIEPAYIFQTPLEEYDVLNCPYIKTPLWTVIGKKVAGKARGTTPLSMEEVKVLITLLVGKNPEFSFVPPDNKRIINIPKEEMLMVDYSLKGVNSRRKFKRSTLKPNKLKFFGVDGDVRYEKVLETIFNQEMVRRNKRFFDQFGINASKVIWFSNYLPYSIEQSEMDYLIIEADDGYIPSRVFLIEFMRGMIDKSHIHRCLLYSRWVNDTLALGEPVVQPILICHKSYDFINRRTATAKRQQKIESINEYIEENEREQQTKSLKVFTYDFSAEKPFFVRMR